MFEFFINAFYTTLYQPLFNGLILIYNYLPGHDFGMAIIILTILTKVIIHPFTIQGIKSQKSLQKLQPKLQEVQKKFKDNKEEQAKALMELYKKEKVNPFSGCLSLLVQLPIFIALFEIFRHISNPDQLKYVYSFVVNPGVINPYFLGSMNLFQPSVILAILTGAFQFIQVKMIAPEVKIDKSKGSGFSANFSQIIQKQMLYFFPLFTVVILLRFPAALALYWVTMIIFTIVEQYIILKKKEEVII